MMHLNVDENGVVDLKELFYGTIAIFLNAYEQKGLGNAITYMVEEEMYVLHLNNEMNRLEIFMFDDIEEYENVLLIEPQELGLI